MKAASVLVFKGAEADPVRRLPTTGKPDETPEPEVTEARTTPPPPPKFPVDQKNIYILSQGARRGAVYNTHQPSV